jgi:hypothetical protein
MARMTKEAKRIQAEADRAFKVHGDRIQFNIFDLSKISKAGIAAGEKGESIEEAVKLAIAQYRKN